MNKVVFTYLIVMGPLMMAFLTVVWWEHIASAFHKLGEKIVEWFLADHSLETVKTIKEFVLSVMMLGTSVATYVGVADNDNSTAAQVAGVIWFIVCSRVIKNLLTKIDEMQAAEMLQAQEQSILLYREYHRKMAGTVRSIVKSELARALKDDDVSKRD